MKTTNNKSSEIAFSFIELAFRDYIAARYLINNGFLLQGLTLASTTVEKYIKVILVLNGKTKREMQVHLNNINKLKIELANCYYDVTKLMDDRFLDILGKIYTIRYYDDIIKPVTIGFFINQFLGELDYIVNIFETKIITEIKRANGEPIKTAYKRAIDAEDPTLFENNYILLGLTKKEHMEKSDTGYALNIRPESLASGEIEAFGHNIINKYDGQIAFIDIQLQKYPAC
jgi:HEPN domain-containing protein